MAHRFWCLVLCGFLVLANAPGAGAAPRPRRDQVLYQEGVRYFDLGRYQEALSRFEEAYRIKPDPGLLFNIGQCQRKLGKNEEAIGTFREYLRHLPPNSPRRADIEQLIAELQEQRAQKDTRPPPPQEPPPPVAPSLLPATRPVPSPVVVAVETPAPSPRPATPIYQRGWFWAGVGALVVSGAVASFLIVRGRSPEPLTCGDCGGRTYNVPAN